MGWGILIIMAICLFFGFFTGMLIYAVLLKKSHLNSMRELPLEKDQNE